MHEARGYRRRAVNASAPYLPMRHPTFCNKRLTSNLVKRIAERIAHNVGMFAIDPRPDGKDKHDPLYITRSMYTSDNEFTVL